MKQEHIDLLKETLQQYGADFDNGYIRHPFRKNFIGMVVNIKRGRIYYGDVASSPITKAGIEKFVESYWYWSKK